MIIQSNRVREIAGLALRVWALALLLFATNAFGQTPVIQELPPPPPPKPTPTPTPTPTVFDEKDVEVVRVTSNFVMVPVSVTDATGQPVTGLRVEDFRLEEEGRQQEIAQIGDPDQVPLDIAILFDVSSSVSERYQFQQQAAARFLKQVMKPADRAAVFAIRDQPVLEQPLAPAAAAAAKLLTIPAATGPTPTAFYDSIIRAAQYLEKNAPGSHRRVILVISDGEDNFSERIRASAIAEYEAISKAATESEKEKARVARRNTQQELHRKALLEVQREVQGADIVFYSINPTGPSFRLNEISTRAEEGMERLAEATGGTSFVPEKTEDLEAVFRQIAAELRSQYLLQYYSKDQSASGKFLRIKVNVPTRSQLRVRARQGYYSKRQ
ncbi:MAG TPA: VWA domain-containing protein [Pyrinomonadaceae bacterium]|nr:VWA domain-containing protein [Pyrinomonadaceae bacterium]